LAMVSPAFAGKAPAAAKMKSRINLFHRGAGCTKVPHAPKKFGGKLTYSCINSK
jgi:hypothetical protein